MSQPTEPTNPAVPSTQAIDPATHTRLASANSGKCWLCGLRGKHASRVIDTPDLPLLHELQRRHITHLADLNSIDNLLFLCSACHEAFSDPLVVWVFLPASLDASIAEEESFHARRQASAVCGERLPRQTAAPATSPVLYTRYQILPGYLFTHIFTGTPTRMWSGAPLAAIIRSARVTAGFESLPVEDGGLPLDVALKLQRLLLLYGAPEPKLGAVDTRSSAQPETQVVLQVRRGVQRPIQGGQNLPVQLADNTNPDLAAVGRAFNSTLNYAQHRAAQQNLSSDAQAWLMTETRAVMSKLKDELHTLYKNKDSPLLLPEYAVNRDATLKVLSAVLPHVLEQYTAQFEECMVTLFNACGLGARCHFVPTSRVLLSYVTFPSEPGQSRLFDPEFEDEFVTGVQALTFQPK